MSQVKKTKTAVAGRRKPPTKPEQSFWLWEQLRNWGRAFAVTGLIVPAGFALLYLTRDRMLGDYILSVMQDAFKRHDAVLVSEIKDIIDNKYIALSTIAELEKPENSSKLKDILVNTRKSEAGTLSVGSFLLDDDNPQQQLYFYFADKLKYSGQLRYSVNYDNLLMSGKCIRIQSDTKQTKWVNSNVDSYSLKVLFKETPDPQADAVEAAQSGSLSTKLMNGFHSVTFQLTNRAPEAEPGSPEACAPTKQQAEIVERSNSEAVETARALSFEVKYLFYIAPAIDMSSSEDLRSSDN